MKSENEINKADKAGEDRVEETPQPILEYVCHPAKRNRNVTILATSVIIICILLVYFITFSPFMTVIGGIILITALSGFYFPTKYSFYDDFFIVKTTTQALRKEWSLYRSYYPDKNGVLLSPFLRPTRMENFRGIYIKFAGNRDEVMKIVANKIAFEEDK